MNYFVVAVCVLAGLINVNLIRVGLETGKIQSRMISIEKEKSSGVFWSAIIFQCLVSAAFFGLALVRMQMIE